MEKFINASEVKLKSESVDESKLEIFIKQFNKFISAGGRSNNSDDFCLNNGLDSIPTLNDTEFETAVKLAKNEGWVLTRQNDNYQSISYKMRKI